MPKHLDANIAEKLGERILEYCIHHNLKSFQVMLHGGEPLLVGKLKLQELINRLRKSASPINLNIGMQTNGVLIDNEFLKLIKENGIKVGISLDGNLEQNKRRVDLKGKSTFDQALRGFRLIQDHAPECLSGILAVIDLNNNATETINFLCSLKPKQLDLLLPFETHDTLGLKHFDWSERLDLWLFEAFDSWFYSKENSIVKLRIFEDVLQSILTKLPRTDWFGPRRITYLVVVTNGEFETLDHLKMLGENSSDFRKTKSDVFNNSISFAEKSATSLLQNTGASTLPENCESCSVKDICAGGYLPHRYSSSNLFNNSSVACTAIKGMFRRFLPIVTNHNNILTSHKEGSYEI